LLTHTILYGFLQESYLLSSYCILHIYKSVFDGSKDRNIFSILQNNLQKTEA